MRPSLLGKKKEGIAYTNRYYYEALTEQKTRIQAKTSLSIPSYYLFIVKDGIECAMYPHLYPTTDLTDTGIVENYKDKTQDGTNRVLGADGALGRPSVR